MSTDTSDLSAHARQIVEQELTLLAHVQLCLQQAAQAPSQPTGDLRSVDSLRALRDQAASASADDLPALLLEMSVRQKLLEQPCARMLPDTRAPYFAHLRLREGTVSKDYLLGGCGYLNAQQRIRIVDWRVAPVAQIFYGYRQGDDYEETFPGRTAEGIVEVRRIVVIDNGVLTQILDDQMVLYRSAQGNWTALDRSALSMHAGGAGTASRAGVFGLRGGSPDVTALLDREQFEALSSAPERPLLVLGTAGSGKTTVALHRLARNAARYGARFPIDGSRVVVPEEGLARLARRLLEPLGVGRAQVQTLDQWARSLAKRVFGEPFPLLCEETPALVIGLKRSPALFDALTPHFARYKPEATSLRRLRHRLARLFTDRAFLQQVVESSNGALPHSAIEATVQHTMLQIAEPMRRQLRSITDPDRKRAVDGRAIEEATPEALAGTVDVDDLAILLFVKAWRVGMDESQIGQLVLDEAEDFCLFELYVLGKLLTDDRSLTLAGDEAQQTASSFGGWDKALEVMGGENAATCRLGISYRCPTPVTELAHRVLGPLVAGPVPEAAHDGPPVQRYGFPSEAQALMFLTDELRDLNAREPHASIAVIAHDADAARRVFELCKSLPSARLVLSGEFSFEPGIDVTDVDNCKGLEFDYVMIPDANAPAYPDTDDARRRLHVAITRASHQLGLICSGTPSRLLDQERSE